MAELHEIEIWLQGGKDFATGKMLYSKYGKYKSVLAALSTGGTNTNNKKLLEKSLRKALEQHTEKNKEQIVVTVYASGKTQASIMQVNNEADTTAASIQIEANKMYSEMGVIHARLGAASTNEERKVLRKLLINKQEQWGELLSKRDYYIAHGKLPEVKKVKKVTKANTLPQSGHQRLTLLRSKVTRAINEQIPGYDLKLKKSPGNANIAKKRADRLKELEAWKAEIIELENGNTNG